MAYIHKETAQKWRTMPLVEQMGNVGSEVERAISWHKRGNKEHFEKAFDRMLELLDLTIADPRWKTGRKELTRVRELLCDVFYGDNQYNTSFEFLQKYFYYFGLASRLRAGKA